MHGRRLWSYLLILLCCTVCSLVSHAQQGNVWYWGNFTGLSFNSTPPVPKTDGQMNTLEGTSVICDSNGLVLFYTDGTTIFNRDHDMMPNGIGLKGHKSSYQSSIIVPKPGSRTIYYVFTSDAWERNGANGYCYSEVDMALDNGRGDVITTKKNIFLSGPSSERLTAIRTADNNTYWVITNQWGTNIFRAYKVDCNGVNTTAVVSTVGKPSDEDTYCNIGVMRVSPDGKFLIQTNVKGRATTTPVDEYAQLFDFNDATGVISNPRLIPLTRDGYYFGAEISPNSKMLYIVNPVTKSVHQFDISSGNLATIMASKTILAAPEGSLAGIAMGPDEKLYLTTGKPTLHVINNPNAAGTACNLVQDQQTLNAGSSISLPNIVSNLYTNRPVSFTYQLLNSCNGEVQFNATARIPGVVLRWDFGDGFTATGTNPIHTFIDPNDEYLVKLTATNDLNCVYEVVSQRIRPSGEQVVANFGVKADCDKLTVQFSDSSEFGSGPVTHVYDFGDGVTSTDKNPLHTYVSNGIYTVKLTVTSGSGCVNDSKTMVIDFTKPTVSAGADIVVTTSSPIQLNATGNAAKYKWTPATYLSDANIANPFMKATADITYTLTGFSDVGCESTDELNVVVKTSHVIEVPNAFNASGKANPVLRPIVREVKALRLFQVYNRWGQLVFSTKTIGEGWDGNFKGLPQPSGAYVWVLEVEELDGSIVRKRGSSILVR